MKRFFLIAMAAATFGLVSCERDVEPIADYNFVNTSDQALVKFNYTSSYQANPGVQLVVNSVRVSGLITSRTPFPGGGYNTNGGNFPDYLPVPPGATSLQVSIPKRNTNTDSITLFTTSLNLEAGKNYTAHIADTGANTRVVLLTDNIAMPDTGRAKYRFVNLMPNVPAIDLYYGTTVVASNIAYLGSSDYFTLPTTNQTAQTWAIRPAGAAPTSTAIATYSSANTLLPRRVYTVFAQGYNGVVSTDNVRKPYVSFLLNN